MQYAKGKIGLLATDKMEAIVNCDQTIHRAVIRVRNLISNNVQISYQLC